LGFISLTTTESVGEWSNAKMFVALEDGLQWGNEEVGFVPNILSA